MQAGLSAAPEGVVVSAKLNLSPWARATVTADERAALLARVPDGHTLEVSRSTAGRWTVRLRNTSGGATYQGHDLSAVIDRALPPAWSESELRAADGNR